MRRNGRAMVWVVVAFVFIVLAAVAGYIGYRIYFDSRYVVVEYNDFSDPSPKDDLELTDDLLADKNPVFKQNLIDSRPLGDWEVNASAAVIGLDCPTIKPERDDALLTLNASYAEAASIANALNRHLLPSANMLDGMAKQFDDGLYAALDIACYRGELGFGASAPDFIASLFASLPEKSPARAFLAGALELAGKPQKLSAEEEQAKAQYLALFNADQRRSKPISFYNWTPELQKVWKFYRYLQSDSMAQSLPDDLSATLRKNESLLAPYRDINAFYFKLTNPPLDRLRPLVEFDAAGNLLPATNTPTTRTIFPPSTSREVVLFEMLFAKGLPPNANMMSELIRHIRSGKVDLTPKPGDGWYQYQAYALESMLLPVKTPENEKLLLTAAYKKRLVEAFKALLTKRRETHARQLSDAKCASAKPLDAGEVSPRLRIEPCATFYLRTARAYSFLENFLLASAGKENLSKLHALRAQGKREPTLTRELLSLRIKFYGFYLVACEDLGMEPQLLPDELADPAGAKDAAARWLERLQKYEIQPEDDLAFDTRMSIPIAFAADRGATRLWATLGVRLVPLEAKYERVPKVRPKPRDTEKVEKSSEDTWSIPFKPDATGWSDPPSYSIGKSLYVLPVDEFAEFELPGSRSLTREEFQAICEKNKRSKEQILEALKKVSTAGRD